MEKKTGLKSWTLRLEVDNKEYRNYFRVRFRFKIRFRTQFRISVRVSVYS